MRETHDSWFVFSSLHLGGSRTQAKRKLRAKLTSKTNLLTTFNMISYEMEWMTMNGFVFPFYIAYLCIRHWCHLNKPEVSLVLNENNHNIHYSAQHTVVRRYPVCLVDDWDFHAFRQIYFLGSP